MLKDMLPNNRFTDALRQNGINKKLRILCCILSFLFIINQYSMRDSSGSFSEGTAGFELTDFFL